jgi:hypothetical protein
MEDTQELAQLQDSRAAMYCGRENTNGRTVTLSRWLAPWKSVQITRSAVKMTLAVAPPQPKSPQPQVRTATRPSST